MPLALAWLALQMLARCFLARRCVLLARMAQRSLAQRSLAQRSLALALLPVQLVALALVEHPLASGNNHWLAMAAIWPKDLAQKEESPVLEPSQQIVAALVVLPPTNLALLLVVVAQVVVEGVCLVPTAQLAQRQTSPWRWPWQQKGLAQHRLRPTSEAMAQQLDQLEVGPQLVLAQRPAPVGLGAAAAFGPTRPPCASRSKLALTSAKELAPNPPPIMSQPRRLRHDPPPPLAHEEEQDL